MNIKTTKLSKFSNKIFLIFNILILSFIWCNYYLKNFSLSFFSSLIITITFSIIYLTINKYLIIKKTIKENQKTIKEDFRKYLYFCNQQELINLIKNTYKFDNILTINQNQYQLDDGTNLYFIYNNPIINHIDMYNIFKSCTNNKIQIFCFDYDKNIIFCENFNIQFITFNELYEQISNNNIKTNTTFNIKKSNKLSMKSLLCIVLSKSNSKKYFKLALLLLLAQIFTPYKIYYIICSSILILISIYCKFNTKFN